MATNAKKSKKSPKKLYESEVFARGGQILERRANIMSPDLGTSSYLKTPTVGLNVTGGPNMGQILAGGKTDMMTPRTGGVAAGGMDAAGIAGAVGNVATGGLEFINQFQREGDTSSITNQAIGVNDISRGDILNMSGKVDYDKNNLAGSALSGVGTGAKMGAAVGTLFGPAGTAIGAGAGALIGGGVGLISGISGNTKKEEAAELETKEFQQNLAAKSNQFQQQDLRASMANYAANGGNLFGNGGMPSQLTEFTTGGTHQENPQGGIMQGTGANGKPNLVEQGETKHEDYIFSNRLKISPKIIKEFKLPNILNGKTFADASKHLAKESKERPNDPISNAAIKAQLSKLTAAQEALKEKRDAKAAMQQGIPMQGQQDPMQAMQQPDANMMQQGMPMEQPQMFNEGGDLYDNANLFFDGNFMNLNNQAVNKNFQYVSNPELPTVLNATSPTGSAGASYQLPFENNGNIPEQWSPIKSSDYIPGYKPNAYQLPFENFGKPGAEDISRGVGKPSFFDKLKGANVGDPSRYAPVFANLTTGLSDILQKPEVVKHGRVSPEMLTDRMDYKPIDTEWMTNKMNSQYAGARDQMINTSGGNRATAIAGLHGLNYQAQNAMGEAYIKADDANYQRKIAADMFNAGINEKNINARNAAQQQNLQLEMSENDMNARNRAAKRNAARQAILNAASNVGDIGRENWAQKTGAQMTGYETDARTGVITFKDGSKYKRDASNNLIKIKE
jgi:hypothetical protein